MTTPKPLKKPPSSPLPLRELLDQGLITPEQHALLIQSELDKAHAASPRSQNLAAAENKPVPPPAFYTHTVGGREGLTPSPCDPFISGLITAHPDDPSSVFYFLPICINLHPSTWKRSPALDKSKKPITTKDGPLINTLLGESRIRESHLTLTILGPQNRPHTIHLSAFGRLSAASISLEDSEELHLSSSLSDRDSRVPKDSPSHPSHALTTTEAGLTLDELEAHEASAATAATPPRPTYTKDGRIAPPTLHTDKNGRPFPSSTGAGGSSVSHSLDLDLSQSDEAPFIPSLASTPSRHGTKSEPWSLKGGL